MEAVDDLLREMVRLGLEKVEGGEEVQGHRVQARQLQIERFAL